MEQGQLSKTSSNRRPTLENVVPNKSIVILGISEAEACTFMTFEFGLK